MTDIRERTVLFADLRGFLQNLGRPLVQALAMRSMHWSEAYLTS